MITQPLKRLDPCWWKKPDGGFAIVYFLSLDQMPTAPHAVRVMHDGKETILRDYEVFQRKEMFMDKNRELLARLSVKFYRGLKKDVAESLCIPYSRVLRVCKEAINLGIVLWPSTNTEASAKS